MSQGKKTALAVAGVLVLCGLILGAAALGLKGFDLRRMSTVKLESGSQVVTEPFDQLSLGVTALDVTILPATDGRTRVEWLAPSDPPPQVRVENGMLVILESAKEDGAWYEDVNFTWGEAPWVTVYLARTELEFLSVAGASGDVTVEGVTAGLMTVSAISGDVALRNYAVTGAAAGALEVTTGSGEITLEQITASSGRVYNPSGGVTMKDSSAKSMTLRADSGGIRLENVELTQGLLTTTSGNITLDRVATEALSLSTHSGDVRGTLLSDLRYEVQTQSGTVEVPADVPEGGLCQVSTVSGDIKLREE